MRNQITVYTTTTCPYCVMAKNFLEEKGIPYKEINIQNDKEAGRRLVETTGQLSVPQIDVNGEWFFGFEPDRIEKLLR